jgi:hypothetical protein
MLAEPSDPALDVAAVGRSRPGDIGPIDLDVPADAVFHLGLAVEVGLDVILSLHDWRLAVWPCHDETWRPMVTMDVTGQ